jgi:hypothetical protein
MITINALLMKAFKMNHGWHNGPLRMETQTQVNALEKLNASECQTT